MLFHRRHLAGRSRQDVVDGLLGVTEIRRRHGFDKPFHLVVAGDVYIDPVTRDTEDGKKRPPPPQNG